MLFAHLRVLFPNLLLQESICRHCGCVVPHTDGAASTWSDGDGCDPIRADFPTRRKPRRLTAGANGQSREVGVLFCISSVNQRDNHPFSFNLQPNVQTMQNTQTMQSGPHVHIQQEDVLPENYAAPMQFEVQVTRLSATVSCVIVCVLRTHQTSVYSKMSLKWQNLRSCSRRRRRLLCSTRRS